jgi:hypothetical protein
MAKSTERFYILAVDDTADYYGDDTGEEKPDCVAAIFGLYLIREGERTHICSTQANSAMVLLANEPVFYAHASDSDRERTRERLDDWLNEGGGRYDMDYYGFVDFDRLDKRRIGKPITVKGLRYPGDRASANKREAYSRALWEAAQEEADTNIAAYYPAILADNATYETYRRDLRNTANERPLGYCMTQLPLFAIAANAMVAAGELDGHAGYAALVRMGWR